jgi:hypothetical protein
MNHALRYLPAPRLGLFSLELSGLEHLPDTPLGYLPPRPGENAGRLRRRVVVPFHEWAA